MTTAEELIELLRSCDKKAEVRFVGADGVDHPIANVENGSTVLIYESTD